MNERKSRLDIVLMEKPAAISVREWRIERPRGQVICLHGLGVSGAEYAPMAEGLNKAGFDVVAPDWIGHGDSAWLKQPEAYDWTSYITCLAAVVRQNHGPATHYVGTSWGGAMLLVFLLTQRLRPRSAIFIDVPIRDAEATTPFLDILAMQSRETFSSAAEGNSFLAPLRPYFLQVPERYRAYLDDERYHIVDDRYAFRFDPAILPKAIESTKLKYNRFPELRRLDFDVLFAYGATSPHRWPSNYAAVAAKLSRVHYEGNMPGTHPPMLLLDAQFKPVIDFIGRMNSDPMGENARDIAMRPGAGLP